MHHLPSRWCFKLKVEGVEEISRNFPRCLCLHFIFAESWGNDLLVTGQLMLNNLAKSFASCTNRPSRLLRVSENFT